MTTVKSINLYTRPERIQKERYDKLLERTGRTNSSVQKQEQAPEQEQLELFPEK